VALGLGVAVFTSGDEQTPRKKKSRRRKNQTDSEVTRTNVTWGGGRIVFAKLMKQEQEIEKRELTKT
jgi:hypothetical protein